MDFLDEASWERNIDDLILCPSHHKLAQNSMLFAVQIPAIILHSAQFPSAKRVLRARAEWALEIRGVVVRARSQVHSLTMF